MACLACTLSKTSPIHLHFEEGMTMNRGPSRQTEKLVWRLRPGGQVQFQIQFGEYGGSTVTTQSLGLRLADAHKAVGVGDHGLKPNPPQVKPSFELSCKLMFEREIVNRRHGMARRSSCIAPR